MTAQEEAQKIFSSFVEDKTILDELSVEFSEKYKVAGKTFKEWRHFLQVKIPQDLQLHNLPDLSAQVANSFGTALYYLSFFEAQLDMLESGSSKEYGNKFAALVAKYKEEAKGKKLPAAATLETLVSNELSSLNSAKLNAKVCRDFFKREVESLTETRKALENSLWALRADMKASNPMTIKNYE